jgi:hypothetical protein
MNMILRFWEQIKNASNFIIPRARRRTMQKALGWTRKTNFKLVAEMVDEDHRLIQTSQTHL